MMGRLPETPEDYQELADDVSAALAEQEGHMSDKFRSEDFEDPPLAETAQTALRALLEQWRGLIEQAKESELPKTSSWAAGLNRCANELEAVLAARLSPPEPR